MAKARGTQHGLDGAPTADTPAVPPEDRSEHHQGEHLDPGDRKHLWQHPASEHDPYPDEPAADHAASRYSLGGPPADASEGDSGTSSDPDPYAAYTYPRWIHKRGEDGAIVESKIVPHQAAHQEHVEAGWHLDAPPDVASVAAAEAGGEAQLSGVAYPRWVHKRADDGTIVESKIVPHLAAHQLELAAGWA